MTFSFGWILAQTHIMAKSELDGWKEKSKVIPLTSKQAVSWALAPSSSSFSHHTKKLKLNSLLWSYIIACCSCSCYSFAIRWNEMYVHSPLLSERTGERERHFLAHTSDSTSSVSRASLTWIHAFSVVCMMVCAEWKKEKLFFAFAFTRSKIFVLPIFS